MTASMTVRRRKSKYERSKKAKASTLYGCLRGSIMKDSGRAKISWKLMQQPNGTKPS
jgi:hypothetical protein